MPALAWAQNTGKLAGVVTDASTGDPLPGANVVLGGTQMGTITDADGNYFILGVPVGTYDVEASFVGYQTQTVTDVEISSGLTREINFALNPGVELQEVVVEYERPIIQRDAVGASRVVTAEDIQNLPVRGVASIAQLQGGVVGEETSGNLYIRGGREQEVQYYINGVKAIGLTGVPQAAIEEQEMLIGTIPARYGDAMSGIISITTKTGQGSRFFGSLEGITSEALDGYGYNLGSLALGGPILGNKLSFFLSGEYEAIDDETPFAIKTSVLSDAMYDEILSRPQVLEGVNADGETVWIPFPSDALDTTTVAFDPGLVDEILEAQGAIGGETGVSLVSHTPQYRAATLTAGDFERTQAKHEPAADWRLAGNLTFRPIQEISLQVGGGYNIANDETYNYLRSLYNRHRFYETDRETWRMYGTWRHYLSNSTFYEVRADYNDDRFWQFPNGFSRDVRDILHYGDFEGVDANGNPTAAGPDLNAPARAYYQLNTDGLYERQFSDQGLPSALGVYDFFSLSGSALGVFDKWHNQQFRLSASATTQVGVHQVEFGGEFEQRTNRRFTMIGGHLLARYFNDGNTAGVSQDFVVGSYDSLDFDIVSPQLWTEVAGGYYGYDYLGLNETDSENVDDYFAGTNFDRAPFKPIYYAGYIQDKIEYRDLVLNLGLRVDVFDANQQVLIDPYAFTPIFRVRDVENLDASVANIVEDDWAVYYTDGQRDRPIVGYRDLEGNFYDALGNRVRDPDDVLDAGGQVVPNTAARPSDMFKDYEPQVIFMPRIGLSFPVTDQALFFASYNVTSQRPSEQSYLSPTHYSILATNDQLPNTGLLPEVTKQYELGFRQRLGERAALQLSGFFRTQNNKIQIRQLNTSFPDPYGSYFNVDFTTTKGATIEFDLRRTNNVSVNANYTLSFAEGTGSDSETQATIAWRGTYFPDFIAPMAFDQRHSANLVIDYRLGEGEGPEILGGRLLENFGVNVTAQLGSGNPYTRLQPPNDPAYVGTGHTVFGNVNDTNMPWSSLVNLRVDRRFDLSNAASLTAFVWVLNLFDADPVLGVWRTTGLPTDDAFLSREASEAILRNVLVPESYAWHYDAGTDNPGAPVTATVANQFAGARAFGMPRRVRLGVRLNF
ncbi:MAG TPA: TonB-dependent receptor [Rhodothermales bacterium]